MIYPRPEVLHPREWYNARCVGKRRLINRSLQTVFPPHVAEVDLFVDAPRPDQRGVQSFRMVCGHDHDASRGVNYPVQHVQKALQGAERGCVSYCKTNW